MQNNKEHRTINQVLGKNAFSKTLANRSSYLIDRCIELCNLPIQELEVEDYRILINQGIALEIILPYAIDILSKNLFAEGDYFEGDLFKSVLTIEQPFWNVNQKFKEQLQRIIEQQFYKISTLEISDEVKENLKMLVRKFQ